MMYLVNPFVVKILEYVSLNIINVMAIVIAIIFIIDNLISLKVISSFKSVAKSVHKDSTAEITKKVREILSDKGRLYRRLVSAFDFIASDKLIKDIKNKVKQGAEFAVETIEKSKKRNLAIKNEIISEYNERLSQLKYAIKMQKKEMKEKLKKIK